MQSDAEFFTDHVPEKVMFSQVSVILSGGGGSPYPMTRQDRHEGGEKNHVQRRTPPPPPQDPRTSQKGPDRKPRSGMGFPANAKYGSPSPLEGGTGIEDVVGIAS